jgi:hypothetical protein
VQNVTSPLPYHSVDEQQPRNEKKNGQEIEDHFESR